MRCRVGFLSVCLSLFTFSNVVYAQTISGSVHDVENNPLGGAVRLFDHSGLPIENFWIDPEGNFQTWPLEDGQYFAVTTFTHEVIDEAWNNIPCENLVCDVTASTPIMVAGGDITGIDFVLEPILAGGRISGLVKDGSNNPLPGVGVVIRNLNGEHLGDYGTDPDGYYETALLANDSYYIHTSNEPLGLGRELWDNYSCQPANICDDPAFVTSNGTAIVVASADRMNIDFSLEVPPGGMISGQITDADTGIVLPDIHMNLLNEFNEYQAHTNTDSFGNYYFSGLADGSYKIYAVGVPEGYTGELYGGDHCHEWSCDLSTSGTSIVLSGGGVIDGRDIELDFSGTRLLGTVTRSDTGLPVSSQYAHFSVELINEMGEHVGGSGTNSAGQYQVSIPAGSYYAVTSNDFNYHGLINEAWDDVKCYDCNPLILDADLIPVADGSTVVADFVLDPGFMLSGTIRFEGNLTAESHVNIWDSGGHQVMWCGNDGSGYFVCDLLPAGTYYATSRGEDFGMVSELYDDIDCPQEFCDVTAGTPIVVSDSNVENIHFDLHPQSPEWTISGSIRDSDDNPAHGVIRLFDPFGGHILDSGTDHHADFQIGPLPNGTYHAITLHTNEMLDEAWDNFPCENLVCDVTASTPIVVDGDNVNGIYFVLEPITDGGRISGMVEDDANVPLAGVNVVIKNRMGEFLTEVGTFLDGTYQTPLLANDTYYAHTANEPMGLGRELYSNYPCLPVDECDQWDFVTHNGTPVVVAGADETDINFALEVPAGGMISGQLTDAETGVVLPDVHMNLIGEGSQYLANTNTDADGNYYFSGLPDGSYKTYAVGVPDGYTGELYGGDHCPDWSCDLNSLGTPIVINSGGVASGRDIALDFSGTRLMGTITRSDTGMPVSGQYAHMGVDLFDESGQHQGTWGTNRAGQYQAVLAAGNYYAVATNDWSFHSLVNEAWDDIKCYYDCDPLNLGADLISVADDSTVIADFLLDPGFMVSGSIRAEGILTGEGYVNIWDDTGEHVMWSGNDGGGNWITAPLPVGTYFASAHGEDFGMVSQLYSGISCPQEFCDVTAGTPIVVTDSDVTSIDFDLVPLSADWTISGSIKDPGGNPVSGAVRFFDPFGNVLFHEFVDEQGNFQTPPVADGTYFAITMRTRGVIDEAWDNIPCVNRLCDKTAATPIVVMGGDVTGIDFVLDPIPGGGHLSGIVEDHHQNPLEYVGIVVRNAAGAWLFRVNTGPDGRFQTHQLANETYYLHTREEPFGLGRELYDDHPCLPAGDCGNPGFVTSNGTPVVISNANQDDLNFSLGIPAGGLISGRLTDADFGLVLPDVRVVLLDDFNNHVAATDTDPFGDYYFSGLADGNYKVYAEGVPEGYTMELYGGDHCPDWSCDLNITGTSIPISGGSHVDGRDIILDFTGTRLLGTVTRSDTGETVPSTYGYMGIEFYSEAGEYMGGQPTNRAGHYQIILPAGNYYLTAINEIAVHGLVSEAWDDIQCSGDCNPLGLGANLIPLIDGTSVVVDFELDPEVIFTDSFE